MFFNKSTDVTESTQEEDTVQESNIFAGSLSKPNHTLNLVVLCCSDFLFWLGFFGIITMDTSPLPHTPFFI